MVCEFNMSMRFKSKALYGYKILFTVITIIFIVIKSYSRFCWTILSNMIIPFWYRVDSAIYKGNVGDIDESKIKKRQEH